MFLFNTQHSLNWKKKQKKKRWPGNFQGKPNDVYMQQWTGSALVQVDDSHYMNQCWHIVNCTLKKKFQWNFNQNITPFYQVNESVNAVCNMAAILAWAQCVKVVSPGEMSSIWILIPVIHMARLPSCMHLPLIWWHCSPLEETSSNLCWEAEYEL